MNKRSDVGTGPQLDDLDAAMTSRYTAQPEPQQTATPRQSPSAPAAEQASAMTRRSWFLPREVADELSAAAARLHHASRGQVPKGQALAALIQAGLDHESEVAQHLGCDE